MTKTGLCKAPWAWRAKVLVMAKLTIFLILIATLQSYSKGYSQGNITLAEKQAPLKKIFKEINRQAGYLFAYQDEWLAKTKPVSIQVTNASLEDVLKICLQDQPVTYSLMGKTIVLTPKAEEKRPTINEQATPEKKIDVQGRVFNEKGEPASGVTVTVKGTSIATSTDENGQFSLTTVDDDATLVFTSINMETFELKVNGQASLIVTLKAKVSTLENVIVFNTGYEKVPKERATGSFQHVDNEELNRKVGPDILSRLEGVTTGILFDRRGFSPNRIDVDPANIQVRGLSTLTRTMTSPLIVLNNFPYEGDINNLNPNDIESISILKDAAAGSIWGAKAANGVIVITTKDGSYNKKPQVTINTNLNYIEKPDLFHYPRMTPSEFIDVETYLFDRGFFNSNINNTTTFPALTPVIDILARRRANQISAVDSAFQLNALRNTDLRDDFSRYFYRSSTSQQYSLNVSGGSQTVKYVMSGGFDKTPDVLVGNERTRVTFFSNTSFQLTKKLTTTITINHASTSLSNNAIGNIGSSAYNYRSGRTLYPYARLADDQGNALATVKDYRAAYTDTAGGGRLLDWKYRPLDEVNNANNTQKLRETILNFGIAYKLTSSLELHGNYQYLFSNDESRRYYSERTYFTRNLVNLYTRVQGNNVTRIIPASGILDLTTNQSQGHSGRLQLNYNKVLSQKHELAGIAGGEVRERIINGYSDRTYGFNENILGSSLIDFVTDYTLYGGNRGTAKVPFVKDVRKLTDRFVSVFGNVSYTYDKRYTVSLSGRRDASNLFKYKR
jgi:TonB-dependent starch-binding outer membrane protein SusC